MKRYHGLERAKGLGEDSMAIQAMMSAGVCNFKKILKFLDKRMEAAASAVSHACVTVLSQFSGFLARILAPARLTRLPTAQAA
jgi:hypothetical protein